MPVTINPLGPPFDFTGGSGGSGAPSTDTYITATDETATLPNSRVLTAGENVSLDTSTANVIKVNANGDFPFFCGQ